MQNNYKQNTNHRKKVEHLYLNRILITTKQRHGLLARPYESPEEKAKLLARSRSRNN